LFALSRGSTTLRLFVSGAVVNRRPEAEFLDQLGLRETSDHPLIATFAERLESFPTMRSSVLAQAFVAQLEKRGEAGQGRRGTAEAHDGGWLGAIRVGHNISQAHYFVFGNKRFGTAAALLCLAAAGTYPDDEKITLLGNLLSTVTSPRRRPPTGWPTRRPVHSRRPGRCRTGR
jgi:hypothetical protein